MPPIIKPEDVQAQIERINKQKHKNKDSNFGAELFNLTRSLDIDDRTAETELNKAIVNMKNLDDEQLKNLLATDLPADDFSKVLREQFSCSDEFISVILKNREAFSEILFSILSVTHTMTPEELEFSKMTFAMPSTTTMMTIIPLFTGRDPNIPLRLLETPKDERPESEQEMVSEYLDSIIEEKVTGYTPDGETQSQINIKLPDNNIVMAEADLKDRDIFEGMEKYRNENLAVNIHKVFGIEGLRHFLGLIICMEEQGRTGTFTWSVNEHLQRLGYKKKKNGSYKQELKRFATMLIQMLDQMMIIANKKDGDMSSIKGKKLFSIVGIDLDHIGNDIINEKITIRAEDFWYNSAFHIKGDQNPQYTKLLRNIVKENHRSHSITVILTPLLSIFWRMNIERKFTVESLFKWCNLPVTGKRKSEYLQKLEKELDYMVERNYLGGWLCNGKEKVYPSKTKTPYKSVLTLYPPDWMKYEFKRIESKRDMYRKPQAIAAANENNKLSNEQFLEIFADSQLNITDFCRKVGIGRRSFYAIKEKERAVGNHILEKVKSAFPDKFD